MKNNLKYDTGQGIIMRAMLRMNWELDRTEEEENLFVLCENNHDFHTNTYYFLIHS